MHPFFHFFGRNIPAYGLMILLGIIFAGGIIAFLCKKTGESYNDLFLAGCIALAGAMTGAVALRPLMKLPDVVLHWDKYSLVPAGELMHYIFGEMVFYGGFLGGTVALIIYCKKFNLPMLRTMDIFAPAVAMGHAFGRIGCLLGGCCYGIELPNGHPLSVIYPKTSLSAPAGVPLFPAPLFEAVFLMFLSLLLCAAYLRLYKKTGVAIGLYCVLYSIERFILEYFRGDIVRGQYGIFTTSQYISMAVFSAGAGLLLYKAILSRKEKGKI